MPYSTPRATRPARANASNILPAGLSPRAADSIPRRVSADMTLVGFPPQGSSKPRRRASRVDGRCGQGVRKLLRTALADGGIGRCAPRPVAAEMVARLRLPGRNDVGDRGRDIHSQVVQTVV